MKLKLGIMTNKELAEWFGIKEKSFANAKKKKLEELKKFADFSTSRGKVNIKKIYIEKYEKKGSEAKEKTKEKLPEKWGHGENNIDTCKRVSLAINAELKNEGLLMSDGTIYNYTRQVRNELFGIPFSQIGGSIGNCVYIWCKRIGEGKNARYEQLTEEEEKIKKHLLKKYFGSDEEKEVLIASMVENGEITKEEAWDLHAELIGVNNSDNFLSFINELSVAIGGFVVKGTMIERCDKSTFFLG